MPIPMSENMEKNVVNTVMIAIRPNASGVTRRARIAVTTSWMPMLAYFDANCIVAAALMDVVCLLQKSPRLLKLSTSIYAELDTQSGCIRQT